MDNVKFFNGEKFMWDGITHENENNMQKMKAEYETNNFEIRIIQEEEKYFLFTRRVVTEIIIDKN
ncbi:MAG: hypothetical protein ISR57_00525 [Bacteroidales bacterium]|nr:hypothetical protein [Bacteroidales bacterium]